MKIDPSADIKTTTRMFLMNQIKISPRKDQASEDLPSKGLMILRNPPHLPQYPSIRVLRRIQPHSYYKAIKSTKETSKSQSFITTKPTAN